MWFKWFLVGFMALSALLAICEASKGKHMTERTPGIMVGAAVLNVLIAVGTIVWL